MAIKDYSTTAADNDAPPPNGWPEGMAPSDVNNCARQLMADIRSWYQDAQWADLGDTPTYVSSTSFRVVGNLTSFYAVGRRVRISDSSTLLGTITASSYSAPNTTVTVALDSGSITVAISAVSIGIVTGDSVPSLSAVRAIGSAGLIIRNSTGSTVATFGPGPGTGAAFNGVTATSISFGGTALANYEEGTFTPTLYGSTTAGSPTYTEQSGYYTRIGNRCFFEAACIISAIGGAVGQIRFDGLPFTLPNTLGKRASCSVSGLQGISMGAAPNILAQILNNTNDIALSVTSTTGVNSLLWTDATSTFGIRVSGQYILT